MKRDLLKVCLEENTPLWDQCLDTPFLQGIAQGTLPEDCFKGYIVDDSLYLREYSKVFAWGMLHARDMAEIRAYYSLLSFVNEGEGATRRQYLKKYGLTDESIQHLPLRPENRAYVDRMIEGARDGEGAAECLMASLPCMLSYGYIFRKMVEQSPGVLDTVYGPFVRDYAGEKYEESCRQWMEFAEKVCENLPEERWEVCRKLFWDCSVHEQKFWEMSQNPREDV